MLDLLKLMILGGFVLAITFLVLVSMPNSKLRDALMPFCYYGFALFCAAYFVIPVDVLPEIALGPLGLVDDAGAVIAGISAIRAALRQRREAKEQKAADQPAA